MERVAAVKSDGICAPLPEEWPAYKARFFSDQQQQGQPISPNAAPSNFESAAPGYAQPAIVMHQPSAAPHYGYGGSSTSDGGTAAAPAAAPAAIEAGDGALPSYKALTSRPLRQMSEV